MNGIAVVASQAWHITIRRIVWFATAALAVMFSSQAALRYLNFGEASYGVFWPNRYALLVHLIGGSVALLAGIFQFCAKLRERRPRAHRLTGRLYLAGGALGSAGAYYMSVNSVISWTFGVAGFAMTSAWLLCAAMAYHAIHRRELQPHREWMVRSYCILFGFVVFRVLSLSPLFAGTGTPQERLTAFMWLSWTVPLLAAEVALQWRRRVDSRPAKGARNVEPRAGI